MSASRVLIRHGLQIALISLQDVAAKPEVAKPNASYVGPDDFTYTVTSGGLTETGNVDVMVASVNHAPTFTSSPSYSAQENQTAVGIVMADDPDHDAHTFALSGGSDQAFFAIDAHTGALSFIAAGLRDAGGFRSQQRLRRGGIRH
jgi:hypothetical protein